MIGYDFDGVITTGRFKPTPRDVIITGNTYRELDHVMNWLDSNSLKCAVYFMPYIDQFGNNYAAAEWKAEMINKLGCPQFYEDNQLQYDIIKNTCSKCDVIKV